MYRIPSSLKEFVKKAKELEEEVGVELVLREEDVFVVAMDEDKSIKYQEYIDSIELSKWEYNPEKDEIIEVIDPVKPLRVLAKSNQRIEELVKYLRDNGVDAYDVEERKTDLEFAEFIGRNILRDKKYKNSVRDKDDEEVRKLAIKIGMEVIRQE